MQSTRDFSRLKASQLGSQQYGALQANQSFAFDNLGKMAKNSSNLSQFTGIFISISDKIKEVPQLADLTYAHTLVIKSTHEYYIGHGPCIYEFF